MGLHGKGHRGTTEPSSGPTADVSGTRASMESNSSGCLSGKQRFGLIPNWLQCNEVQSFHSTQLVLLSQTNLSREHLCSRAGVSTTAELPQVDLQTAPEVVESLSREASLPRVACLHVAAPAWLL